MGNVATKFGPLSASKSILVVDDNAMLLKFWERILKAETVPYSSYKISRSPRTALRWLEDKPCDTAIIDIVMPHQDGFEFAQAAWALRPQLQLVFTTAYDCDFRKVKLIPGLGRPRHAHVLLKPYQDIDQVEEFLARLNNGDPSLSKMPAIKNEYGMQFHLWHL